MHHDRGVPTPGPGEPQALCFHCYKSTLSIDLLDHLVY
uniref:Uncharacterized protein n=1 Tax=Anguilla anguilla TaxID=7936 RepID=A0A0E9UWY9_ANGAN